MLANLKQLLCCIINTRKMLGKLNLKQIDEILTKNLMGRIGCHYDGLTYVVPISYAYDGEFIYSIAYEGMKLVMMRNNPKVCFEVDEVKDMLNWESVIVWGEFEEILEPAERKEALSLLRASTMLLVTCITSHEQTGWPFIPEDVSKIKGVVFRIRITEKTGRFEFHSLMKRNRGLNDS